MGSRAFAALPISLAEAEPTPQETTPGELLASALAAYLGLHLALRLERERTPLRELAVDVQLGISPWPSYVNQTIDFGVRGRLCDGEALDEETFVARTKDALEAAEQSMGLTAGLSRLSEIELL